MNGLGKNARNGRDNKIPVQNRILVASFQVVRAIALSFFRYCVLSYRDVEMKDTKGASGDAKRDNRLYPPWVGIVMTFLCPGAAQFFSGKRLLAINLFLVFFLVFFLFFLGASLPGVWGDFATVFLLLLFFTLVAILLIISYCPTKRLGVKGWILFLFFTCVLGDTIGLYSARAFKAYFVHGGTVMSSSMSPTFSADRRDFVIVNKWLYKTPRRGDVILCVLRGPLFVKETLGKQTKRIVGLPGDTVDIEEPYVIVNGQRLVNPAIFAKISTSQEGHSGYYRAESMDLPISIRSSIVPLPITLGPDEYFVLGDNSYHSADSRFIGPIKREDILGRAVRIIYPLSRFGQIE